METKVRVGVRVRPLLPNEQAVGSEMVLKYPAEAQIGVGERYFTYDHVFSPEVSQERLYRQTAGPMLKSFVDGYNVTILAYGQTGSGKTYTMGSEAGHFEASTSLEAQGLIPRFLDDLFRFLSAEEREATVTASFLEIYGEDIFDLLDETGADDGTVTGRRVPLPVREDSQGVVVAGLKQVAVMNRAGALNVLRRGTMNRTTAATLMNVVSSRSHAVFTVTLHQVVRAAEGGGGGANGGAGGGEEDEGQVVVSKLTFVDLAGSERLKKTGAEGTRRREGIQINVGLLALGNVINALADEERLAKGKQVHVPYRQSKLTRLLQDALGGNSQTLFLACVSPADMNVSETLSTLHYANRARNIRNKPVKNTDSVKEELRCLRQMAHFLKAELVRERFGGGEGEEDVMERQDVCQYLEGLGEKLNRHLVRVGVEGVDGRTLITRPFAPATPNKHHKSPAALVCPMRPMDLLSSSGMGSGPASPARSDASFFSFQQGRHEDRPPGQGGEEGEGEDGSLFHGDPEREMELLQKLRELQRQEGELGEEEERGTQELAVVQGELEQKEELLEQLKQTLEGYHAMRARFEKLQSELEALETQKVTLMQQLEQNKGGSESSSSIQLRDKLKSVEAQLDRLRVQKKEQENVYRLAERQREEVKALEESVGRLKTAKVQLMKKQKEATKAAQEAIQQKRREVEALRKAGRQKDRSMGKLQLENRTHKLLLDRKDQCIKGLKEKVARSEAHVTRLLSIQSKSREAANSSSRSKAGGITVRGGPNAKAAAKRSEEKIQAVRCLLEQSIEERLQEAEAWSQLDMKVREYERLMEGLKAQTRIVEDLREGDDEEAIREAERQVEELDVQMELCAAAIEDLRTRLDEPGASSSKAALDSRIVMDLEGAEARTLLLSLVDMTVEARRRLSEVEGELKRRACAEEGLKIERSRLERRLSEVGRGFEHRITEIKVQHQRDLVTVTRARGPTISEGREEEEEDVVDDDEVGKRQLTALLAQIEGLEARCQSLTEESRVKAAEAEAARAEVEQDRKALADLRQTLQVVMEMDTAGGVLPELRQEQQRQAAEEMTGLQELWRKLGLEAEETVRLSDEIVHAASTLRSSFLSSAKQRVETTESGIAQATKDVSTLHRLLGRSPPSPPASGPLLPTLQKLELQANALRAELAERRVRRDQLAKEAVKLEAAIGTGQERSPALSILLQGEEVEVEEKQRPIRDDDLKLWEAEVGALRRARSKLVLEVEQVLERVRGRVAVLRLDGEALCDMVVQQALTVEKAGDTARAKTLQESILSTVCTLAVSPASSPSPSLTTAELVLGHHHDTTPQQALSPFAAHARFVLEVLGECERARVGLSELMASAGESLADEQCLGCSAEEAAALRPPASASTTGDDGSTKHEPVTPDVFSAWVGAVEVSLQAVVGRCEHSKQQADRLAAELGVSLAAALGAAGKGAAAEAQEAANRLTAVQGRVKEAAEVARIRRYPEAWQATQLARLTDALQRMEGRIAELGRARAAVSRLETRKRSRASILKLNDDIMAVEGKLRQFETDNSDRTRLTDRKANSANRLLKEEKFRKDSQARLAKLMEKLRQELDEWEKREGAPFDRALLGEDIRRTLLEGHTRGWVEGRTELMHLHTTSSSSSRSRGASPTEFEEGLDSPPPPSPVLLQAPPPVPSTTGPQAAAALVGGRDPFARILSTGGSAAAMGMGGGNLLCLNRLMGPSSRPAGMADLQKVLSKWDEEEEDGRTGDQENSPNNRTASTTTQQHRPAFR